MINFKKLLLISSLQVIALYTHADPQIAYTHPTASNSEKLTYDIAVESYTKESGYYWATQFYFNKGGKVGYIGIQPRPGTNMTIFSAFGQGALPVSDTCRLGADGGAGVSCSLPYAWVANNKYTLTVENTSSSADYNFWQGSITDTATQEKTVIGEFKTPTAWQKLWRHSVFFDEWFKFNGGPSDPNQRACVPYAKFKIFAPKYYKNNVVYQPTVESTRLEAGKDKCAIEHNSPNLSLTPIENGFQIENGVFTHPAN